MKNMTNFIIIADFIGQDIRSRNTMAPLREAAKTGATIEADFSGVVFITRSVADEICIIADKYHNLKITGMQGSVLDLYNIVSESRKMGRHRPIDTSTIRNFDNIKEFSAFMRNL